jgi:hypothetical protein
VVTLRKSTHVLGSAIRALGNPNDPSYGFASALLNDLMPKQPVQPAQTGPTTQQVRDLLGPDGSGTVTTDLQRPVNGGGAAAGGPPVAPVPSSPPPPDGPQEPQGPQDPIQQTIVITGKAWQRDDDGNQLELGTDGRGLLHLAGGGVLALDAAEAATLARLATPTGTGSTVITGSMLLRLAGGAALALTPVNSMPVVSVELNERVRFERSHDQWYGRQLELDQTTGQWEVARTDVALYQTPTGFAVLSDKQLALLRPQITTPALPPGNSSPPRLPVPTPDRDNGTPGYVATPPVAGTPGLPAAPPLTPQDLIIESRQRADDAWRANPNLRSPTALDGTSDGGPGQWGYSPTRTGGEAYQEQITGVPRGVEYNVNGVWFDGYDPSRGVLIDSKDWVNYPPAEADFWKKGAVEDANRQLDAARGTGARVEWQVSSQHAADALNELISGDRRLNGRITVVVVPKR